MIERILIPLDGSETAEAILPQVRRVLQRHQAEVILLHATPVYPPDFHLAAPGLQAEGDRYIRRMTFQAINDGLRCRGLVRSGFAAETILDAARSEDASLIAMSTHGRTGLSRWILGSVAEKIVRASATPVLVLRSFHSPAGETIPRGRLEELPFRNILVPLDGSPASLHVLEAVRAFARPIDAHVTLLAVLEDAETAGRWRSPGGTLEAAAKQLAEACIPSRAETRVGDPALEILKASESLPADLIAMSTHGRSGPSRWVLGSVTEKVLRGATRPMLIARQTREAGAEAVPLVVHA
jgi:nucleotide-binding universal stress UspA family protein